MAYIAYTKGKEPTRRRVPIKDVIRAGQFRPEDLGLKGRAGFMGYGTYTGSRNAGGYRRTR